MGDTVKVHKTCVRVHSADAEEDRDEVDSDLPKRNPFIRGSDPRVATCRGRLQTRRCQLNQEINKELRLRAGAENLFKATTNRKLRETVALELSFVNSNLQLLKEQLAELNSSVELYQSDSKDCVMPMVPLGLKETKEVDFREPFKDFILEHYSEDAAVYEDAISDFMDMRQAMRTPVRSTAGAALLFKYYNHLYYIERRFFPPDRSLGVYFEWFDSLTGVPSCQRTVAFEKACVLFNIAGIYTQIGAKQERGTAPALDAAVDAWLRAAGALRYVHDNFTNAPSVDLAADTLLVLTALMTAQARECLLEKLQLQGASLCGGSADPGMCLDLAQECAVLAVSYTQLYEKMQLDGVFNYVPYSWVSLVHIKTEFYKGLCHEYVARGLASPGTELADRLDKLYVSGYDAAIDENGMSCLMRAHACEALALYEEAARLQRMCRELRTKESLSRLVRARADAVRARRLHATDDDTFDDLIDAPAVLPSSKFQLTLTPPDFSQHRVEDLFKSLGPIAVFSAKRHWSAPRLVQLQRNESGRTPPERNGLARRTSSRRDRSEDNSAYYGRDDERRVTKQHGVYITDYNGDDYHPEIIDYDKYEYRSKLNGDSTDGVRTSDYVNGKAKQRERRKEPLRRAASEFNVSSEGGVGCGGAGEGEGFGFSVRGDAPVVIAAVEPNSLADIAGMREGDFIVSVGGTDVKWSSQQQVVRLLRRAGHVLTLRLASPMDARERAAPGGGVSGGGVGGTGSGSVSVASSSSSRGSGPRPPRRAAWNPFRRPSARATPHSDHTDVFYRHHLTASTLHSH